MSIKKHIPNFLTCCNLLCGCVALVKASESNLVMAAYFVFVGLIFDFLDGFAARLLKVTSAIGKDLDSLADMVTFGLVPGVVMYKMIMISNSIQSVVDVNLTDANLVANGVYLPAYLAFSITIFSAIRLAKFNNDKRQSYSFIGLPTPANAIFCCSLPLIINSTTNYNNVFIGFLYNPYFLCIITLMFSLLLVAELPLFALKFKNFEWADNKLRFVFLGLSLVLLGLFQYVGIPLIIIMYILLSVGSNLVAKNARVSD